MIYVVENMCKRCQTAWVAVRRGSANRSRTSGRCLAGLQRGDGREGGETGGARLRSRLSVEPCDNAVDIDRGGNGDVLQVGLRHAPVPGPAQAKGADPLRQGAFDASAPFIALLPLVAGIPRA